MIASLFADPDLLVMAVPLAISIYFIYLATTATRALANIADRFDDLHRGHVKLTQAVERIEQKLNAPGGTHEP
jgi:hypothetical protein